MALQSDFLHLLFVDEGVRDATESFGATADRETTAGLPENQRLGSRGVAIATTDMHNDPIYTPALCPNRDELMMAAVAHELTHLLIEPGNIPGWDVNEHTIGDPNGNMVNDDADDRASLMNGGPYRQRSELATVKFFPVVQVELRLRTGEWGTL